MLQGTGEFSVFLMQNAAYPIHAIYFQFVLSTVCRVWIYLTCVSVTTDTQYSRPPIYDGLTPSHFCDLYASNKTKPA